MKTDSQLQQDVVAKLKWPSEVLVAQIGVKVKDGVLALSGDVEWQFQRQDAADPVRYRIGLIGVSNQICIKRALNANAVKSCIEAVLKRRATAAAKTVAVAIKGGGAILSGTVHSGAERGLATRSAWGGSGVRCGVVNMTLVY